MIRDTLLFDINETVLNLNSLEPLFLEIFGDENKLPLWFNMLLHSSTVCTITGVKTTFASLAHSTLDSLAARSKARITTSVKSNILDAFSNLQAHPDIKPALTRLRSAGYRTIAFSNSSLSLITNQIAHADLQGFFDEVISAEETKYFKPDPRLYEYAAKRLKKESRQLRLIASHDWDIHGALTTGMLGGYIDRTGAPYNPHFQKPDIHASTMMSIVDKILEIDASKSP